MVDSSNTKHARAWALFQSNQLQEAKQSYEQICKKSRRDEGAWLMLGIIHARLGSPADAEIALKKVIGINSRNFDALVNLGLLAYQQGLYEQALQCYRRALAIHPQHADVLYQVGNVYAQLDLLLDAEEYYRQALDANPAHPLVIGNLANVLAYQGRPQDAIPMYRKALKLQPSAAGIHSNLLLCLHYLAGLDPHAVFDEHAVWGSTHARNVRYYEWDRSASDADRRLHIGYVTPDLREHSVAYFLKSLLRGYDKTGFSVSCYSDLAAQDATTRTLASMVDSLRDTRGLSNDQVAALIRQDKVDILVDLAGHTENNRLLIFAHRPAPVQITYLGYPDTTGLDTIDYRITDQWTDPPGHTEHLHTEELLRLECGFLCYSPPDESPHVNSLPRDTNRYVTFGSFNAFTKISPEILMLWSELLQKFPDARLLIKNRQMTDERLRERTLSLLESKRVERERVYLIGRTSKSEHMAVYSKVDIALDTYPYNGTTTTCDALWMGVPVVSLAGKVHVSRVGVSLLSQVGLDDLVAYSEQQYIETATALAADTERLRILREDLRERMRISPLCDGESHCHSIEKLYRDVWARWCCGGS